MKNIITDLNGNLRRNRVTDDVILEKNENALKQHIDLLLLCSSFAAIGRPYMCAGLREFIAEPHHEGTLEEIRARVTNALKYENRVRPIDIDIRWDEDMKVVHIQIEFEYVNADKTFTYQTRLRRVA